MSEQTTYSVISFPGDSLPEAYRNMIYSKWLRSLRYGNDYFKLIDSASYYSSYQKYIELLLSKPNCTVRLAVLSDNHDVVLGFCVHRDTVLDYCHVQKDFRKQGIGMSLLPPAFDTITHVTYIGMSIWASKYPSVKLNPFI